MSEGYQDVFIGDIGTVFRVTLVDGDVVVNVNDASVRLIRFFRPDSGILVQPAVFTTDGVDGQIEYVAEEDFLSEAGTWKLQGYVETPTGKWSSSIDTFVVNKVLA